MNLKPTQAILSGSTTAETQGIHCISEAELHLATEKLTASQQQWLSRHDFKAKPKTMVRLPDDQGVDLIWLGIGDANAINRRDSSAWLSRELMAGCYQFQTDDDFELALGWTLGQYQFSRYLAESSAPNQLLVSPETLTRVSRITDGLFLTRDLINTPANDMGPSHLAEVAKQIAIEYGANYSEIADQELLEKGLRTIFTVGQAADNRPRLLELNWGEEDAPRVTLVGKGVCFDSGGLDIKPSAGMRIMKKDMGGAAHALGLASIIMASDLKMRLRVLIPAVENSIAGNAYRPGDIIKTYKGTTVEVDNTDAEGRLVLCDALTLACEQQPELLIDFATLTGAARVAMGTDVVPFFTDDEQLASDLARHSEMTNDPIWRLPLYRPYEDDLKSAVADLSNTGKGPFGGAITAALFLKHFIAEGQSWVHFDLYGWNNSNRPTCPEGGQSMAIHGLLEYLKKQYG